MRRIERSNISLRMDNLLVKNFRFLAIQATSLEARPVVLATGASRALDPGPEVFHPDEPGARTNVCVHHGV
jgi:hypothetical protein